MKRGISQKDMSLISGIHFKRSREGNC